MPEKITDSFIEYVNKKTKLDNDCVVFIDKVNNSGYAIVGVTKFIELYKTTLLHRMVYIHYNDPIPQGLVVMHSCDNRACVNIKHLSLGTVADNNFDMMKKGRNRQLKYERHNKAKLNWEKVNFIRRTRNVFDGVLIASVFNCSKSTINSIRRNETWVNI